MGGVYIGVLSAAAVDVGLEPVPGRSSAGIEGALDLQGDDDTLLLPPGEPTPRFYEPCEFFLTFFFHSSRLTVRPADARPFFFRG